MRPSRTDEETPVPSVRQDLRVRCWFDAGVDDPCGALTDRAVESPRGPVPCCPRHDPGNSRAISEDDLRALAVMEVLES